MSNFKRLHAIVHGRVQGVFFRAFVREFGRKFNLTGWVKNLPDGSVETIVEGEDFVLKQFLHKLNEGPPSSHVEKIETKWLNPTSEFKSFEVRY